MTCPLHGCALPCPHWPCDQSAAPLPAVPRFPEKLVIVESDPLPPAIDPADLVGEAWHDRMGLWTCNVWATPYHDVEDARRFAEVYSHVSREECLARARKVAEVVAGEASP